MSWLKAGKQAHKLKSSLGLIGSKKGLNLATNIEHGADKGHDYMVSLSAELREVCSKTVTQLQNRFQL